MILTVAMVFLLLSALQINGISLDGLLRTSGGESRQRLSLTVGHNNGVAPFILAASFLAFTTIMGTRSWMIRLSLLGFVVTCWILIVFCLLTRSTMIGLVFGGALLLGVNLWALSTRHVKTADSQRSYLLKWALVLSLVFVIGLIVAGGYTASKGGTIQGEYNPNLARNIVDRLRTFNPDILWRDTRARLWTISFHMMRHHPLLGVGFSGSKIDYPFYQASFFEYFPDFPAGPTVKHTEGMHNDYLQWAVECGAAGTVLLVWLLAVLAKITRSWIREMKRKSLSIRFAESATLIACVALMMDALFSFPAHIAPLAICLPGMAMLWFGCVYGKRTQPSSPKQILKTPLPLWGRLGVASAIWAVMALPLGAGRDHIPFICQTGVWSPITAQVVGNAWHTRLMGSREAFQKQFNTVRGQIQSGTPLNPKELATTLESIRYFQTRCQQAASLIPFAGDAIYDISIGVFDAFKFLSSTRPSVMDRLAESGRTPESIVREYNRTGEVLAQAESLFRQSLRNYHYHSLYWYLGLIDLERAKASGTPLETRDRLIKSGLENLATARRIFGPNERVLEEILANLAVGEDEGAGEKVPLFKSIDQTLITDRMQKGLTRSTETNSVSLNPSLTGLSKALLPHLGPTHSGIVRETIPLLERSGEAGLAKQYLEKETQIQPQPLGEPFWPFRIQDRPETMDEFNRLMEEYRTKLKEKPGLPLITRVLFLSDLQRFAPSGADMSEWREAVLDLPAGGSGRLAGILRSHMLAAEAISRGCFQEAWGWELEGQAGITLANYAGVSDRRPGVTDASLWGLSWPLLAN